MAKYTATQIAEALTKANGIISTAARIVGCDRSTVHNYINKSPSVKKALEDAREATTDEVESELLKRIREGDTTAIIFYLKTVGRNRGYAERQEVTGSGGGDIVIKVKYDDHD